MKLIGIVGRKDSGKTHLVVRLVGEFGSRGLSVSTIKHTHHHDIEVDSPGKDSHRHRAAGATEVVLASDTQWVLFRRCSSPPSLPELLQRLAPCDLVIVEGYKQLQDLPRIEVFRGSGPEMPLARDDAGIGAIACEPDRVLPAATRHLPRLDLDDTRSIADFILSH